VLRFISSAYWPTGGEAVSMESIVVRKNRKLFAMCIKTKLELVSKFEKGVYVKRLHEEFGVSTFAILIN
jgi:hypothetical protein